MKLPWVSRERLEDAERRLNEANIEKLRYLDMLLSGAVPDRRVEVRAVEAQPALQEDAAELPAQGQPEAFGNPFDRIEKRMGQAMANGGRIPIQFRARMN
jgi:hypothetical protein